MVFNVTRYILSYMLKCAIY